MTNIQYKKSRSFYKKKSRRDDSTETFFLYVAFHSIWSSIANIFSD
jgi:hypothetical protein